MKHFFFDTANIGYINSTWDSIKSSVPKELVVGITTNPNAFYKINKLNLSEWTNLVPKLCETVSAIRNDDKGVVYVQGPNSNMTADQTLVYAEKISKLTDGNTRVGLKIPPYAHILKIVPLLSEIVDVNVTGLADASTALKCVTYNVRYISIIPGRMEEVGIDAKSQIEFVNQSNLNNTQIIAGSMRTLDGLIWTFQYLTVPTIGERVWDLVLQDNNLDKLLNIDYNIIRPTTPFSPIIDNRNYALSEAFFQQMDKCGEQAYSQLGTL